MIGPDSGGRVGEAAPADGGPVDGGPIDGAPVDAPAVGRPTPRRRRPSGGRRSAADLHFMRYLPGSSVIHRLWAGTKLIAVALFSLAISLNPTWSAEGILALSLVGVILIGRIPWSVAPRVPVWFLVAVAISGLLTLEAGGPPTLRLGHVALGLGGVGLWALYLAMTVELLLASAVIGWTTPLADLAPALGRLLSPLARLRLPIDEVVVAVALSVRCLPLLIDELRILVAARRARGGPLPRDLRGVIGEAADLLSAVLATSARRAREMGAAIQARGGLDHAVRRGDGPGLIDAVAMVAALGIAAAMIMV